MEIMESIVKSTCPKVTALSDSDMEIIALSDCDSDSDESSVSIEIVESRPLAVIDLDDTAENSNAEPEIILINDSIVSNKSPTVPFVIDTKPDFDSSPDFIPVPCYHGLQKRCKRRNRNWADEASENNVKRKALNQQPNFKERRKLVHSQGERISRSKNVKNTPVIQLSYPNILNSNAEEIRRIGLRPIIIDGCNVGFGYGNGDFKMQGIILVIQYFKNRGHEEIVCFLPQSYRHRVSSSEEKAVASFKKEDIFSFTPSRKFDDGRRITPYDDRYIPKLSPKIYIVQYASEREGIIISNDGYRDLINEEPAWRETIEKRIINYTFARGLFMLPKDPLGPNGPTLDEMLRFP